eukprot:INCI2391.1.p2 GENE.INCI2391.1~~INCI2391.1.p2  ORF type:complete len:106 (+),score=27.24 INCI2391.1:410-727(+)
MVEEVIAATAKPGDYDHITESTDALDAEVEKTEEDGSELETCPWTPAKDIDDNPTEPMASTNEVTAAIMASEQGEHISAANIPAALVVDADSTKSVEEPVAATEE